MKKMLFSAAAIILLCAAFLYVRHGSESETADNATVDSRVDVSINGTLFKAYVSDTPAARAQGLSGVRHMKENAAMLFIFPNEGSWGIWMKDMKIPIDILWLDSNKRIVHIEKNISPETYPNIFFPRSASLYVIELPAGTIDSLHVSEEDSVVLPENLPVGK